MCCLAVAVSAVVILVVTDPQPVPVAAPFQAPATAPETLPFGFEAATPPPTGAAANAALAPTPAQPAPVGVTSLDQAPRVLFVGNSYTLSNDLPGTVDAIAAANGVPLDIGVEAKFGFSLGAHLERSDALDTLYNQAWDTVVVQELSVNPANRELFATFTQPAAGVFADTAHDAGTAIVFFQTWAHREGNVEVGQPGYGPMQQAVINNYATLANTHQAAVAPVGEAWATTMATYPELNLYVEDGVHPSPAGSYLAALVLARTLTSAPLIEAPPIGVSAQVATELLEIANSITG